MYTDRQMQTQTQKDTHGKRETGSSYHNHPWFSICFSEMSMALLSRMYYYDELNTTMFELNWKLRYVSEIHRLQKKTDLQIIIWYAPTYKLITFLGIYLLFVLEMHAKNVYVYVCLYV